MPTHNLIILSFFSAHVPAVFFQMNLPVKKTLTAGDTVLFTQTVTNSGNVYNTNLGFFQPPVDGVYSFSATLCVYPGTWMVFGIMVDSKVINEIITGEPQWHTCDTSHIVTYITTRQKVWVKLLRTRNGVMDKAYGISSFSGFLLTSASP